MPIGTDGNRKWPFWSVTADRENPRSWLVMVTLTPGITPPDASWAVPETVPVWTPCARLYADPPHNRHSKTNAGIRFIGGSSLVDWTQPVDCKHARNGALSDFARCYAFRKG